MASPVLVTAAVAIPGRITSGIATLQVAPIEERAG